MPAVHVSSTVWSPAATGQSDGACWMLGRCRQGKLGAAFQWPEHRHATPTPRAHLHREGLRQRLPQLPAALARHGAQAVAQLLQLGGDVGGGGDVAGSVSHKLDQLVPYHLRYRRKGASEAQAGGQLGGWVGGCVHVSHECVYGEGRSTPVEPLSQAAALWPPPPWRHTQHSTHSMHSTRPHHRAPPTTLSARLPGGRLSASMRVRWACASRTSSFFAALRPMPGTEGMLMLCGGGEREPWGKGGT